MILKKNADILVLNDDFSQILYPVRR